MKLQSEDRLSVLNTIDDYNILTLAGLRLLVVDSNCDAREIFTYFFEMYGAEVMAVASTKEGLEICQRSKPDVLISEICIPEEDGYSLIRRVRQLETERGEAPVLAIAVTTYVREEDRIQAFRAGFHQHFPKPVDPAKLVKMVVDLVKVMSENVN